MAKNNETPWWEPRTNTGNYKQPKNNFWRDLSQPWSYWRPTIQPPVYGYSYPFESAGMYDFNIPLGYNTPQTYTPDLPASNIGDPNFYLGTAPPAAAGTLPPSQSTAPATVPGTVANPEMRYFNPYLQTAPTGGTGGVPPQAPLPEGYQYPYWLEEKEGRPAYMWDKNEETGQIELVPNENAFPGAPVPELDVNGNPWTSVYSKDFYSTQEKNPLQWLAGSSNGGNMGSRGWRRQGRYYIPDQQVTRVGPNGPITAERPKPPPRRGETPNPEGNNKNLTIPAWVGSLVSWRT